MNPKTVLHRLMQACGMCLPLLLIVGLLIPGCAGKRSDMLSSVIKPKQDTGEADEGASADDDAASLIAGADSKNDNSRLSAYSAEEIIEGPPKLSRRLRSWFTRDDETLAAGDPFLDEESTTGQEPSETTSKRQAVASSDQNDNESSLSASRVSQTTATESIDDVKPWWEEGGAAAERRTPVGGQRSRVDEMLASFQTRKTLEQQSAEQKSVNSKSAWWEAGSAEGSSATAQNAPATASAATPKTTFSDRFDSRLQRLRAELNLDETSVAATEAADADSRPATEPAVAQHEQQQPVEQQTQPTIAPNPTIAARGTDDEFNPFATTQDSSQDLPVVAGNNDNIAQNYPSLMTQPRTPSATPEAADDTASSADRSDARTRVHELMADARNDWQAWRLDRAYETAVAAQELAVRENVQLHDVEDQPEVLVRKIAADRSRDAVPALADQSQEAFGSNPFDDADSSGSSKTPFGFAELDRLANPWTTTPEKSPSKAPADPASTLAEKQQNSHEADTVVQSQTGGVSLLPPDDDFPSDADARDWSGADPRDIRLATHKFPQFSRSQDEQVREQMKGLSAEDNQALLQNVADQKNRVLRSKGIQWPELPAAHQPRTVAERSAGPIQVAEAPRFTLEDDIAIAAPPDSAGETPATSSGGSLLGQFWRSQPIWFIGGLVLLILAMRLWPSPGRDEA